MQKKQFSEDQDYLLEQIPARSSVECLESTCARVQKSWSVMPELDFLFLVFLNLLVLVLIILGNFKHVPKSIYRTHGLPPKETTHLSHYSELENSIEIIFL